MKIPRRTPVQRAADAIVDIVKVLAWLAIGLSLIVTLGYYLFCAIHWT
ncbi:MULTISPECIES: hypothetical protein [Rhodococcus]|nr:MULTISPECIES: hypothetical protein [Rhodococcus]